MKKTSSIHCTLEQLQFINTAAQSAVNEIAMSWSQGYEMEASRKKVSELLRLKAEVDLCIRDWDLKALED